MNIMTQPLVTIGIPTFSRPELLKRALSCVAKQNYKNIEVIVSDNCTPGTAVQEVVDSFKEKIKNLSFKKHSENIGGVKNIFSLLDVAHGTYFMWLADDDEISFNYVSSLVAILEKSSDAVTAAGHWFLMTDKSKGMLVKTSNFPQESSLFRVISFIWKSDDAFFYGLHRTSAIKKATFPGYMWPNKNNYLNWAYILLFDMVLAGRVLITSDRSVQFINHDYSSKLYLQNKKPNISIVINHIFRRINVHYLYLLKTIKFFGTWMIFPASIFLMVALCREFGLLFLKNILDKFMRIFLIRSS